MGASPSPFAICGLPPERSFGFAVFRGEGFGAARRGFDARGFAADFFDFTADFFRSMETSFRCGRVVRSGAADADVRARGYPLGARSASAERALGWAPLRDSPRAIASTTAASSAAAP